jgi:beta-phosphoglucomutase-like phosphatase (HAD superfamily)
MRQTFDASLTLPSSPASSVSGKPHDSIFRHALTLLDVCAERSVMCGDSLSSDIDGALSAGVAAIWVNRLRQPRPTDRADVVEVATLADAGALLIKRQMVTGRPTETDHPLTGEGRVRRGA